jgi:branched-chain amino acid transport system ATP-binding protein
MSALIECRALDIGYGETTIVRDLDLEVHPGEVVALLGPNGAGKTTTISALSGMLRPQRGDIFFKGSRTEAPLHLRCRAGLGLVTERRAVLMNLTVDQNLKVARADKQLVLRLFPELGDHLGRPVGLLSGGQQQMLALGQALARRPQVLLADELSLGLAPIVVGRLLAAVRAAADEGLGVLLVEQQVHLAMKFADRAYVLRRGRVELSGTVRELGGRLDEIQHSYLEADELSMDLDELSMDPKEEP